MSGDLESVVRAWTAAYTEEVAEFAPPDQVTITSLVRQSDFFLLQTKKQKHQPPVKVNDSQVFGEVFHSLIHSPLSMTLLQVIIFVARQQKGG